MQEVAVLKKDVLTYERMAKQAEVLTVSSCVIFFSQLLSQKSNKNKEGQLKRALDTIARLKSQLQDAQQQLQVWWI